MEKKKKVIIVNEDGYQCEHLLLNESQISLLNYLEVGSYLYGDLHYEVIEDEVQWKEI